MDIKIISQNIVNNPSDFTAEQIEKYFEEYARYKIEVNQEKSNEVNGSCPEDELEEMKRLAHKGLPDDCIQGWGEVKFCSNRQGDGNMCKRCSNYH